MASGRFGRVVLGEGALLRDREGHLRLDRGVRLGRAHRSSFSSCRAWFGPRWAWLTGHPCRVELDQLSCVREKLYTKSVHHFSQRGDFLRKPEDPEALRVRKGAPEGSREGRG